MIKLGRETFLDVFGPEFYGSNSPENARKLHDIPLCGHQGSTEHRARRKMLPFWGTYPNLPPSSK